HCAGVTYSPWISNGAPGEPNGAFPAASGRRARYVPLLMTRTRRLWLLGLAVWIVLGLMSAAQNAAWRAYTDRPIIWADILPNSLGDWLTCGMFTPAFYWMVRQFPIRGERWWARLPVRLPGVVGVAPVKGSVATPALH